MSKFKVGDKARYVNAGFASSTNLILGKEYEVLTVSRSAESINVSDYNKILYSVGRFELVTEPKVNHWRQELSDGWFPKNAVKHTMPDGVVMWRIPEPVIADGVLGFDLCHSGGYSSADIRTYSVQNDECNCTNDYDLKGKTKDGKPFGIWTVDFGGDT